MMWVQLSSELSWGPGEQGNHETSRIEAKRNISFGCCRLLWRQVPEASISKAFQLFLTIGLPLVGAR